MKSGKKVLGSKTIQIPRCAKIVAVHKPIHHALGYQLQTSKPVFSVVTILWAKIICKHRIVHRLCGKCCRNICILRTALATTSTGTSSMLSLMVLAGVNYAWLTDYALLCCLR